MKRTEADHVFFVLAGYFAAALAATISLQVAVVPQVLWHPDFITMTSWFTVLVSVVVLPVVVPFIYVAERKALQSLIIFASAGFSTALYVLVLVYFLLGWPDAQEMDNTYRSDFFAGVSVGAAREFLVFSLAGVIGGLTYWAIAGRHSGNWRLES